MSDTKDQAFLELEERPREAWELSPEGIADSNRRMIELQRDYRRAADTAAKALIPFKEVQAVAVFGAVAMPLWKEVPRFSPYQHHDIALWHACPGINLAVWLDSFKQLSSMRMAIVRALERIPDKEHEVVLDELAVNFLEHGTDRYVGNLCHYKKCPAAEPACEVPGCGAVGHLRQFSRYRFDQDDLHPDRCFRLFDRATATVNHAVNLPGPQETDSAGTA